MLKPSVKGRNGHREFLAHVTPVVAVACVELLLESRQPGPQLGLKDRTAPHDILLMLNKFLLEQNTICGKLEKAVALVEEAYGPS